MVITAAPLSEAIAAITAAASRATLRTLERARLFDGSDFFIAQAWVKVAGHFCDLFLNSRKHFTKCPTWVLEVAMRRWKCEHRELPDSQHVTDQAEFGRIQHDIQTSE
ncbi:MAG: hypothetical protein QHC77_05100 [Stenotrophomonas sp.]|uniref:hypothetical protein n=1 Tax=Stenotrophomonas sp. TaxID=69392 RepID=UPI0029AC71AC|nr:hypothetical protein [Stenotrophomonas sp.]MDX3931298.1 hypothetical protein [Stenotrophomonas sp.]